VARHDVSDTICFDAVRQAIQLQQHHSDKPQPLTNDEFAKVSIFRDQDAAVRIGHLDYVLVGSTLSGLRNGDDIMAVSSKSFDNPT
jgi:hypothetical protein